MKKISLLLLLLIILAAAIPASGAANEDVNSYIVVMSLDPVIAYDGSINGLQATQPAEGDSINLNSANVQNYQEFLRTSHDESLAAAGASAAQKVNEYTVALNGYSALLTEDQVKEIENQTGVAMVIQDELLQVTTDSTPEFLGLTGRGNAWAAGYTGEGVVVGVIDTGIWPEHPSFADDGSYAAPPIGPLPCEFGNTAHNPDDVPFTCNNKLIGAYQMLATYRALIGADPDEFDSARDDDGHGTHTASTAAGNSGVRASIFGIPRGRISGIAPRAHVVAYKGLGNLGGFTSDLAAAIDQAVTDGVDVINYSIGGGAALPGADEIAFLFAANTGVFVATSAGNSGPGPATAGNPGTVPWLTTVAASTQERFFESKIKLHGGGNFYGASITKGTRRLPLVDAADAGDDLCNPGALDPTVVEGKIVLCRRGAIARAAKSLAVYQAGGAGMILYNNSDDDNLFTDNHWVPSVHVNNTDGLAIKAYIASKRNPKAQLYTGRADEIDAPSITYFSSRGENAIVPDIIKPDITAPGHQILAGNSPYPDPGSTPPGELFQAISGTSMSSPHIAGIFALIKQAHPDWTPAMAKSAIMTTAYQDVLKEDRQTPADPFDMGAGHVDPGSPYDKGSAFQPGLVYDAGLFEYAAFTCGSNMGIFTPGSCDFLASLGIPFDPSDLNLPSIGVGELPGSQTVQRTVTSVADEKVTYRVDVDAPPGYKVTVSPSVITLDSGESVTYEVTITNESAPIGEWAFGSLTWESSRRHGRPWWPWDLDQGNHYGSSRDRFDPHHGRDDYEVYSPIAVRAALFDAPDLVAGSGESGTASFDVKFGYTGNYAAAAHGLVAATVTSDNVLQDPDQTFSPSDVATGGANLHEFNLSGTVLFRIAMPPEATEANADLDIFVYDPSGALAATSTSGGTNELIDILQPADGTWSVYVHGWSSPGGDSDYDMYTWDISATPGGNLIIDAAPSTATIGSLETIDLSWTGATAGQWHLGTVSHTGDVGLLGLTLVDVDNR